MRGGIFASTSLVALVGCGGGDFTAGSGDAAPETTAAEGGGTDAIGGDTSDDGNGRDGISDGAGETSTDAASQDAADAASDAMPYALGWPNLPAPADQNVASLDMVIQLQRVELTQSARALSAHVWTGGPSAGTATVAVYGDSADTPTTPIVWAATWQPVGGASCPCEATFDALAGTPTLAAGNYWIAFSTLGATGGAGLVWAGPAIPQGDAWRVSNLAPSSATPPVWPAINGTSGAYTNAGGYVDVWFEVQP